MNELVLLIILMLCIILMIASDDGIHLFSDYYSLLSLFHEVIEKINEFIDLFILKQVIVYLCWII